MGHILTSPARRSSARGALSIACLCAVAGCTSTRWLDRFTSFHVDPLEAARIDELDARSPARHPSTRWIWYTSDKPTTAADCQYWRAVALNSDKDTETVRRYIQGREQSVCSAFRDVFEDVSQAELERKIAKSTERTKDDGDLVRGELDPLEPLHFSLDRGKCYHLVFRLEPGFVATADAKKYSGLEVFSEGARFLGMTKEGEEIASGLFEGHGAIIDIGCPTASGPVRVETKPAHLAKGRYSAQLRSIAHSDADYEEDRVAWERAAKESEVYARQRLRQVCADCAEDLRDCIAHPITPTFDCNAAFAECLDVNASAHPADCSP